MDYFLLSLVHFNDMLRYADYLLDIVVAIPFFLAGSRLRATPDPARQFTHAGIALAIRAGIPYVIKVYAPFSEHFAFPVVEEFMLVTFRQYLPGYLVLAAAIFVGNGVNQLVATRATPQPTRY